MQLISRLKFGCSSWNRTGKKAKKKKKGKKKEREKLKLTEMSERGAEYAETAKGNTSKFIQQLH